MKQCKIFIREKIKLTYCFREFLFQQYQCFGPCDPDFRFVTACPFAFFEQHHFLLFNTATKVQTVTLVFRTLPLDSISLHNNQKPQNISVKSFLVILRIEHSRSRDLLHFSYEFSNKVKWLNLLKEDVIPVLVRSSAGQYKTLVSVQDRRQPHKCMMIYRAIEPVSVHWLEL